MDSSVSKINALAESLSTSIKTFLVEENNVNTTVQNIGDFILYLQGQYSNTSKYKSVESDIIKYLESYDFKRGHNFDVVKHCCDILPNIEGKIAQMSQMAKSVHKRPDRYGLTVCVNDCVNFTRYCAEEMAMGEVDKVLTKSSTLIQKLQKVIDAFRKEDDLLKDINLMLKEQNQLLRRYPAYEKELSLFLSSYPHENNIDMQYVKQRLQDLSAIDKKFIELKEAIDLITKYADRHEKKNIVSKSKIILEQGTKDLIYADLYRVNDFVVKALTRINEMKKEFQKEKRGVSALYKELQANTVDMWQEDSERIRIYIKQIMDKKTCYVDFSMDNLIAQKSSAIQKKKSDIQNIILKYHWLKRSRYQQQILNLSKAGVSYDRFIQGINNIKSSRGFITKLYELIFYNK